MGIGEYHAELRRLRRRIRVWRIIEFVLYAVGVGCYAVSIVEGVAGTTHGNIHEALLGSVSLTSGAYAGAMKLTQRWEGAAVTYQWAFCLCAGRRFEAQPKPPREVSSDAS